MEGLEMESGGSKFGKRVAVTIAILAAFLAMFKVKSDNIVQQMHWSLNHSLDQWNYFQAKSIKQSLFERQISHWTLQSQVQSYSSSQKSTIEKQLTDWREETERYQKEKTEAKEKAEELERQYESLQLRQDQFDLADALLSLGIALFAIASLNESWRLFYVGTAISTFGVLMGLAGFFHWHIRPFTDWF